MQAVMMQAEHEEQLNQHGNQANGFYEHWHGETNLVGRVLAGVSRLHSAAVPPLG